MAPRISIRVGAIENAGPNTLVSYLRNAGSAATQIDIAVAFVTSAGLDSILHVLKRAAYRSGVRFLTGLYQGFTEPKALKTLLREQRETGGRFSVQVSRDSHFHWKCYFLLGRSRADAIVGSSNLTDDGLRQSGEFNAVLNLHKSSKQFRDLHAVFDRHWQFKSESLSEDMLAKYEHWRATADIPTRSNRVPLIKILGRSQVPRPEAQGVPNFWRTCIDGTLSPETVDLLQEITDWDKRGYGYCSVWKPTYKAGDRVVLFDLNNRSVGTVEIKEMTISPRRTPDGYHFAAYRFVSAIPRRKLVPRRWKSLRAGGLIRNKSDAYLSRKLTTAKFDRFVANLKETAK